VTEPKDVSASVLRELAWEEGSLVPSDVPLPVLTWVHPDTQAVTFARKAVTARRREGRTIDQPVPVDRAIKQGDRLAVTTQTCDIIKGADLFPQVEVALVFETAKSQTIANAQNRGSARYFLLKEAGDSPALILDFGWRTHLDKGFLVEHAPDNSLIETWDPARRRDFARWLGRRYSRPVLSDEDDDQIARPVRERWGELVTEDPETAARYSAAYAEFRFRRSDAGRLEIFLLSPELEPDAEIAFEIAEMLAEVLEPIHGEVSFPTDRRSYHTFTVADLSTTEQIDLESASQDEDSVSGVHPAD
jgi:hypothetical protein